MVGDVGGQPFRPVAPAAVDGDARTPPAVGDFVAEAGLDDERQADDAAAEKGPAGKAVAGGEEIFDHGIFLKGIGAENFLIEFQVAANRRKIGRGQFLIAGMEIAFDEEVAKGFAADHIRSGGEGQGAKWIVGAPGGDGTLGRFLAVNASARGYRQIAPWRFDPHLVSGRMFQPQGIPGAGEKGAPGRDAGGDAVARVFVMGGITRRLVGKNRPVIDADLGGRGGGKIDD